MYTFAKKLNSLICCLINSKFARLKNRKLYILIACFCVVKLALAFISDFHSGFQGDELLHIQTGNHPDFGYMEFPPLIGWLAYLQNLLGSTSVFVHHIFTHLAALAIMLLLGLIIISLGGRFKAVFIVLLCVLVSPGFGRSQQLFQPVVFSQLFWVLSFYQLLRFTLTLDKKYLLYLALSLAFGFLAKYDIVFFGVGLLSLLVFSHTRKATLSKSLWKYILVFLLLVSANIWWQWKHDFPVLQMFSRLYETQLDQLGPLNVIKDMVIALNPLTAPFYLAGLIYMFIAKKNRPIAVSILISIIVLALSKSKFYYFFPVLLSILPFGGVWFENQLKAKRKWILYPVTFLLVVSGIVMIPFGMAVLPLDSFIKFAGIQEENGRYPVKYQEYYSPILWDKTLLGLQTVYDSLPKSQQQSCLIWGKHYRQAGAVSLFRESYHLPKAFSYHGSFYLWAPTGKMPTTVLAFTNKEAGIDFFQSFFNTVIPVKKVFDPYADEDEDSYQTIFVCRDPKQDFDGLHEIFKSRVFE